MKFKHLIVSLIGLLVMGSSAWAQERTNSTGIRSPLGVYVHIDIEDALNAYNGPTPPTSAELHAYLRNLFAELLADPAVSGLTVGRRWDNIQLAEPVDPIGDPSGYDWSYLDDAFDEANAVNKSVQLIITPGFDTPQWLLSKIPSCDGLFANKNPGAPDDCGKVTFSGFPQQQRSDGDVLPLPWNSIYQQAWRDFLKNLNARYASNPAFVSIAVAGPTGPSTEMILPTSANTSMLQLGGLPADKLWAALIMHSFPDNTLYQKSDQVFIDNWDQTIDSYEKIFSGVTLFLSPDAGNDLPKLAKKVKPHSDNILFAQDCSTTNAEVSCEAKTEILSYFVNKVGPNGKSTQVGGMTASSSLTPGDISVAGVKVLTSLMPPPSPAFLGGAEFDHPVSGSNIQVEGCPSYPNNCKKLSVEEAGYHVFTVFFYGTPVAGDYGGTQGSAPVQYVGVNYVDIQYAQANPCPAKTSKKIGRTSLQDLLNLASHDLFEIAGQPTSLPPPTCDRP